jgi:phage virion morphogenesis protein
VALPGARLTATLDDKDFQRAIQRFGGVIRSGMLRAIGTALVKTSDERFQTKREPFGAPWAKLLPAYADIKRGSGILFASGTLVRSLTYQVNGSNVIVGSNVIYAAVHQFGATITAKNAPALAFQLGARGPRGGIRKAFVHVQSVHIPARPYLGFGPNDQRTVMDVLQGEVRRAFGS